MRTVLSIIGHTLIFILLTVLTQLGGLVWLLSLLIKRWLNWQRRRWLVFPALYLVIWAFTPLLAGLFGRVPLPWCASETIPLQAHHFITILANRHYVVSQMKGEVIAVAKELHTQNPDMVLTYLDANFPFWDGFPLLPHKSHDDGEKLDLAFFYQYDGQLTSKAPSFIGYGRVASPESGEHDQPTTCARSGYWQYSLLTIVAEPFIGTRYTLNQEASRQMVRAFARRQVIRKLFLEPHLKQRWRLGSFSKIRFHGCAAVRHDDHLHIQL